VPVDHNPAILTAQSPAALVTTATSQPALRTGFAMLGLVSLLDRVCQEFGVTDCVGSTFGLRTGVPRR